MHRTAPMETSEEQNLFFSTPTRSSRGASAGQVKNFVLDTNVLLHDPHCLNRFDNNHLFIPVEVLSELDRFKNEQTERGANARTVHRFLTQIFDHETKKVTRGVKTAGGGTVRIFMNDAMRREKPSPAMRRFAKIFPDREPVDHRIMAACLAVQEMEKEGTPCILVTKDLNMQLKAMALGITCQDYLNDKVSAEDAEEGEIRRIIVEAHELQRFGSSLSIDLEANRTGELEINEYVLLAASEQKLMPARHMGGGHFQRLKVPQTLQMPRGIELRPANLGQLCFLDALLDPEIALITCYGQAGTGKTLTAVGAGLYLTGQKAYNGMTVSRPVVAMGDTLGFLPGSLEEKLHPWLQSIYDAFEVLLPANPHSGENGRHASERKKQKKQAAQQQESATPGQQKPLKPYEQLMQRGLLEIEALCYIRGRSIPNRFFVLDEAQQLTPLEAKTVVTRMSRGSKLVMVGDPAQIDNPYVDRRSNGLVHTRNKMRGHKLTAHISLTKGERSPLAEMGAQLM